MLNKGCSITKEYDSVHHEIYIISSTSHNCMILCSIYNNDLLLSGSTCNDNDDDDYDDEDDDDDDDREI